MEPQVPSAQTYYNMEALNTKYVITLFSHLSIKVLKLVCKQTASISTVTCTVNNSTMVFRYTTIIIITNTPTTVMSRISEHTNYIIKHTC